MVPVMLPVGGADRNRCLKRTSRHGCAVRSVPDPVWVRLIGGEEVVGDSGIEPLASTV